MVGLPTRLAGHPAKDLVGDIIEQWGCSVAGRCTKFFVDRTLCCHKGAWGACVNQLGDYPQKWASQKPRSIVPSSGVFVVACLVDQRRARSGAPAAVRPVAGIQIKCSLLYIKIGTIPQCRRDVFEVGQLRGESMAKFYINFRHGDHVASDDEGIDLSDVEAAKDLAMLSARELIAEAIRYGGGTILDAVIVADEGGEDLVTIFTTAILRKYLLGRGNLSLD